MNKSEQSELLSVGCLTVKQLKENYLSALKRLNEKDRPPGFDSWEAYHRHVSTILRENKKLKEGLTNGLKCIEYLEQQQAMPDEGYKPLKKSAVDALIFTLE